MNGHKANTWASAPKAEIEELVESDCDEEQKAKALKAAERFRRAASL